MMWAGRVLSLCLFERCISRSPRGGMVSFLVSRFLRILESFLDCAAGSLTVYCDSAPVGPAGIGMKRRRSVNSLSSQDCS